MSSETSQMRVYPGSVTFGGPLRELVTARSVPLQVFDVAVVSIVPDDPWANPALGTNDYKPAAMTLSVRDFSLFLDAVQADKPNDALRQAVARRPDAERAR